MVRASRVSDLAEQESRQVVRRSFWQDGFREEVLPQCHSWRARRSTAVLCRHHHASHPLRQVRLQEVCTATTAWEETLFRIAWSWPGGGIALHGVHVGWQGDSHSTG